jgi:hypothetical protein
MAELILKHKDLVMDILEHDSLLQNNEAEELDENDRNAAWEDYEKERDGIQTNNLNSTLIHNLNLGDNKYLKILIYYLLVINFFIWCLLDLCYLKSYNNATLSFQKLLSIYYELLFAL